MRKIIILLSFILIAAACQKKEEPRQQYQQFPSGPIITQDHVRILQEAVKKDPKDVKAWIELGNIMMDSSRFAEAIEAYQKALNIDPKNVDVRVDMGTCYRNIGKPDIAVREYRKAIEINPNHINGHRNLAIVLAFDLKDNKEAAKEFERYLALAPNASDAEQVRQEILRLKAAK
jgi:tetratricopeptide (TPR) repeat protein